MHYSTVLHFFTIFSNNINSIIVIGGYPVLFLLVLLEGIPLVGTIVPGHIAVIAAGFLAHSGIFNIWIVLFVGLISAMIGDALGFLLGRRYGINLIDRFKKYFFIRTEHINKAQSLLSKHTGKAMILGRLSPVTRSLMPFLVGTGKTSHAKFWAFNFLGAFIWVGASVILGYGFGFGFNAAASYFGKAVVGAIVFGGLIIWGYRFINIRFHIFRKYELFALILNIISLITLSLMIRDALSVHSFMTNFDIQINGFMNANVGSILINIAETIGQIGEVGIPITAGLVIGAIFVFHGRWRSSTIVFLSIISSFFMFSFMKEFFLRPRPDNALQLLTDPSFPSGHATMAATLFFVLAYLFAPKIKNWIIRESFIVFCVLSAIIIGLSRIVLNVHWASDVIAGWSLGVFCATASIILVRYTVELVKGRRV